MMKIDHLVLTVKDICKTVHFYENHLGFKSPYIKEGTTQRNCQIGQGRFVTLWRTQGCHQTFECYARTKIIVLDIVCPSTVSDSEKVILRLSDEIVVVSPA